MFPFLLHEGMQRNSVDLCRHIHQRGENMGTFSFFISISIILLVIERGQNANEFLAFLLHLIHEYQLGG